MANNVPEQPLFYRLQCFSFFSFSIHFVVGMGGKRQKNIEKIIIHFSFFIVFVRTLSENVRIVPKDTKAKQ